MAKRAEEQVPLEAVGSFLPLAHIFFACWLWTVKQVLHLHLFGAHLGLLLVHVKVEAAEGCAGRPNEGEVHVLQKFAFDIQRKAAGS